MKDSRIAATVTGLFYVIAVAAVTRVQAADTIDFDRGALSSQDVFRVAFANVDRMPTPRTAEKSASLEIGKWVLTPDARAKYRVGVLRELLPEGKARVSFTYTIRPQPRFEETVTDNVTYSAGDLSKSVSSIGDLALGDEALTPDDEVCTVHRLFENGKANVLVQSPMGSYGLFYDSRDLSKSVDSVGDISVHDRVAMPDKRVGTVVKLFAKGTAQVDYWKYKVIPDTSFFAVKDLSKATR